MSKYETALTLAAGVLLAPSVHAEGYGLGKPATPREIAGCALRHTVGAP